jgi:hypothetical protein
MARDDEKHKRLWEKYTRFVQVKRAGMWEISDAISWIVVHLRLDLD